MLRVAQYAGASERHMAAQSLPAAATTSSKAGGSSERHSLPASTACSPKGSLHTASPARRLRQRHLLEHMLVSSRADCTGYPKAGRSSKRRSVQASAACSPKGSLHAASHARCFSCTNAARVPESILTQLLPQPQHRRQARQLLRVAAPRWSFTQVKLQTPDMPEPRFAS